MLTPSSRPNFDCWPQRRLILFIGLVYLATFVMFLPRLLYPTLWTDDFAFLRHSWTWPLAKQHLWIPINDHAMPLARLSTYALIQCAGNVSDLPFVLCLQGPLAVWFGMPLVYLFLRREFDHPVLAVIGMALFGISTQYYQAVWWYAATFSVLALDTFLIALLAAQGCRRRRKFSYLLGCAAAVALTAGWTGGGIVAGPLCALYLIFPGSGTDGMARRRRWLEAIAPMAGTAAFLAICLPLSGRAILNTGHYEGKTALEAFGPIVGLLNSCRSVVDNLLLGSFGLSAFATPLWLAVPLLLVVAIWGVVWWRRAPGKRSLLLGLACIFGSSFLIFGARAAWPYELLCTWTRYQVFPSFGLSLFLIGGLARWQTWLASRPNIVASIVLGLFMIQSPRAILELPRGSEQATQFRRIDEIDALCRQYHIGAGEALRALPPWKMVGGMEEDNAWYLLRGSDEPMAHSPEEIRRLLWPTVAN